MSIEVRIKVTSREEEAREGEVAGEGQGLSDAGKGLFSDLPCGYTGLFAWWEFIKLCIYDLYSFLYVC